MIECVLHFITLCIIIEWIHLEAWKPICVEITGKIANGKRNTLISGVAFAVVMPAIVFIKLSTPIPPRATTLSPTHDQLIGYYITLFDEVTRATQRKRLRQLAAMTLQRYGIEDAKLRFISDSANTVFRVDRVAR